MTGYRFRRTLAALLCAAMLTQPVCGAAEITSFGGTEGFGGSDVTAAKLRVNASVSGDTITVTLSGNKGIPVDVVLYNEIGIEDRARGVSDTAVLTFSGLKNGWYSVFAEYTEGGASDFADVEVTNGKQEATPTPEPTATPTPEPTATPTPEPTATPTPEPTATPTPEPTATTTPEPTATPTPEPTATPTPEPTATPTPEPTATPTPEPTATPTPEPTATPTAAPLVELITPAPTQAPTATPTPEPTATPTAAPLVELITPAPTQAPTATPEPTATPTAAPLVELITPTPTQAPTATPEPTAVPAAEPAVTPTAPLVELITPVPAGTPTPVPAPTAVPAATPDGRYSISVSTAKGALHVAVQDALAQAMIVEITLPDGSTKVQTIAAGNGTASFTGLPAGVYSVYLDYAVAVPGVKPVWQEGITLLEGADTAPVVSGKFTVNAGVGGTAITVEIAGAKAQPVDVVLIRPDKTTDVRCLAQGNGVIAFTGLADGSYSVVAAYQTEVPGVSSVKREGLVVDAVPDTASPIIATASAGVARVDVSVASASALPVAVTLLSGGAIRAVQRIEAGVGSVSFTGLPSGAYSVSVDYAPSQNGVTPCVIGGLNVAASVAKIAIASVSGGENRLNVTGTAQPGAEITLTTEPASTAVIVRADASGRFAAQFVLGAGTYTAVHAQYGANSQSRVTARGTYAVTAPAVRPPISVNPVSHKDSTVTARSTPGTLVNLGTYDYGQTLTADARGLLQYSLPHEYPNGTQITFTVYYGEGRTNSYKHVITVGGKSQYALLKRGDRNTAVFELTSRLVELGYLIDPTIGYDDTVVAAVRLFQKNNGLTADGVAGPLTQSALYSVSAIAAGEAGVYPTLVRGDKGLQAVYNLQRRLKELGYYTIAVDGAYGSGTQRAVRDFQYVNGLAVTGTADHVTQTLLYASSAKPAGSAGAGTEDYITLSRSAAYNARVIPLQRRLKELGYLAGSVDGYFGSQTQRAVRYFQYVNGIAVTGVADAYTQQVLYSAAAKTASGAASGTQAAQYRLLTWGSTGEDVVRLQKALLAAGYKQVRTADGIYGQWTYEAVRAFQKDHGLDVDGIAGRLTQNKLYGTNY